MKARLPALVRVSRFTNQQQMPGSIQIAAPSNVMPNALCTAFSESRDYVELRAQYHDGTAERSQLAQTSRKTFKLAQRLTAARTAALKAFWDNQQGGVVPFLFYNLAEGTYDATGNSTQGRYTVVFRGNWSQTTGLFRTDVPQIELIEVA
jgi:hypothetical protein